MAPTRLGANCTSRRVRSGRRFSGTVKSTVCVACAGSGAMAPV